MGWVILMSAKNLLLTFVTIVLLISGCSSENVSKSQIPENIESYKESCKSVEFNELNRNPKDYENNDIYIEGTISDIYEDAESVSAYVDVNNDSENKMLIVFSSDVPEQRVLEGDSITAWGAFQGVLSSDSTPDKNSIIGMNAYSVVINEDEMVPAEIKDSLIVISEDQFKTNYNLYASLFDFETISDFEFLESDKNLDNIFYQYYFKNGTKLLLSGYKGQNGFESILIKGNNADPNIEFNDNLEIQEAVSVLSTVTRSIFGDIPAEDFEEIITPLTDTIFNGEMNVYKYNGLSYFYLVVDNELNIYIEVDKS